MRTLRQLGKDLRKEADRLFVYARALDQRNRPHKAGYILGVAYQCALQAQEIEEYFRVDNFNLSTVAGYGLAGRRWLKKKGEGGLTGPLPPLPTWLGRHAIDSASGDPQGGRSPLERAHPFLPYARPRGRPCVRPDVHPTSSWIRDPPCLWLRSPDR